MTHAASRFSVFALLCAALFSPSLAGAQSSSNSQLLQSTTQPADPISQLPSAPGNSSQTSPTPAATLTIAPTSTPQPTSTAALKPESLRDAAHRLNLALPLPDARIIVTKSARTLELFSGATLVKTYRVALGAHPLGAKATQGDGRTPEGRFFICTRNSDNSAFHIFLGLSYPALPDAERAVNHKEISWRDYMLIQQRLASRAAPLWGTRLGGWVGIHGGTGGKFASKKAQERGSADWTAGCIALTNSEIEEVYSATKMGTPVTVRP